MPKKERDLTSEDPNENFSKKELTEKDPSVKPHSKPTDLHSSPASGEKKNCREEKPRQELSQIRIQKIPPEIGPLGDLFTKSSHVCRTRKRCRVDRGRWKR